MGTILTPSIRPAVTLAVATPSSCVPAGGVLLSAANLHHRSLRRLQFSVLRAQPCLHPRVVSVCYGFSSANDTGVGACVEGPAVSPSDFREQQYASLTWAKWEMLVDALSVAELALWVDADVLLLQNPFEALGLRRGMVHLRFQPSFDLRFQADGQACDVNGGDASVAEPSTAACARAECRRVNSGQMLLRSRTLALAMLAARPAGLSNRDALEQTWLSRLLAAATRGHGGGVGTVGGYATCALPPQFMGHCTMKKEAVEHGSSIPRAYPSPTGGVRRSIGRPGRGLEGVPVKAARHLRHRRNASKPRKTTSSSCQLASYHANCRSTLDEKERLMSHVLAQFTQRCIYKGHAPPPPPQAQRARPAGSSCWRLIRQNSCWHWPAWLWG